MSDLIYITFSGADYDQTTRRIVESAPGLGCSDVLVFDDAWLDKQPFRHLPGNRWLWEHPVKRGHGWFAWKPMIIMATLERVAEGDVVLYTDADTYPVADLTPIHAIADRDGLMLFESCSHRNRAWVKRDALITMAQDDPKYLDCKAGCARFCAFKRGPWIAKQFLAEWLTYAVNPNATTKDPPRLGKPEHDGFVESRDEQAIMTLLAHKYGVKLHREADQAGEGWSEDRDLYPQLFEQVHQTHGTNGNGSRFRNVMLEVW